MNLQAADITEKVVAAKATPVSITGLPQSTGNGNPSRPPPDLLPGHGEKCPVCQGTRITGERISKNTGKPYVALFCTPRSDCRPLYQAELLGRSLPGHDTKCPSCEKGKLVGNVWKTDKGTHKKLICSRKDDGCAYSQWVNDNDAAAASTVNKMPRDGTKCPKCGIGTMITKEKPGAWRKCGCSRYPECNEVDWDNNYEKSPSSSATSSPAAKGSSTGGGSKTVCPDVTVPGHGTKCPKCRTGTLIGKSGTKKDDTPYRVLNCSRKADGCEHFAWVNDKPGAAKAPPTSISLTGGTRKPAPKKPRKKAA